MGKNKKRSSVTRVTRNNPLGEQFIRGCKCVIHDVVSTSGKHVLHRVSGHDYVRSHWKWLVDNGHLGPKAQWVCNECLDYAAGNISVKDSKLGATTSSTNAPAADCSESEATTCPEETNIPALRPEVNAFLEFVDKFELREDEISTVLYSLGRKLNLIIYEDSKKLLTQYKDLNHLCQLDHVDFLRDRPKCVLSFLQGITNQAVANCETKKLNALCILLEQLYFVRNGNFIGPLSFSQHLVKWTISGSKTVSTVDGSTTAAGSVTSLQKVMKESSKTRNVPPVGDVDVFFDNTQRTGKTTRVRESGTTPVNVATNVVFIQNDPCSNLQKRADLKPAVWLGKKSPAEIKTDILNFEKKLSNTFRAYRFTFQSKLLGQVLKEIEIDDGGDHDGDATSADSEIYDHVAYSTHVKDRFSNSVVCPKCSKMYSSDKTECDTCGFDAKNMPDKQSIYGDVPCGFIGKGKAVVELGEIIGVNPNSKSTVRKVLENIAAQTQIGEKREWVRLGCDGLPYRIAHGLIMNTVRCKDCGKVMDIREISFNDHIQRDHPGSSLEMVTSVRVFDTMFLVPGAGHTEINILRALFALVRHIFLENVAENLGFKSKPAKEFIVKGCNHHVTWQVFYISLNAFALEMLYEYVVDCMRDGVAPSAAHFRDTWLQSVKNSNFLLLHDLIFDWFLGLHCFRNGVRRGNSHFALCGRQKVAPIMYTGKHPIYQQLLYSDMKVRLEAPEDIVTYIENNDSFSVSGDLFSGEGGDYITENENRSLKSHLSPGVPTLESWTWASRCHKQLQLNREAVFKRVGIKDPGKCSSSIFSFELEVQMVRRMIRVSGVLKNPKKSRHLTSLEDKLLHPSLVNVISIAKDNYEKFLNCPVKADLEPVFVTDDDETNFNNVKNWTIKQIDENALAMLDTFTDEDSANLLREIYSTEIRRANKAKHIEFHQTVKEAKDMQEEQINNGDISSSDLLDN